MSQDSPNVIAVGWSVIRSLVTTRAPTFSGVAAPPDHAVLGEVLQALEREGMGSLQASKQTLENYVAHLSAVAPSTLGREDALAFWLNLYNAGALALTARATGLNSVLRIPGGFSEPFVTVEGEGLSLDAIEHAKIRRFRDPRIHGALVCGSVSCPTLRRTPYVGASLDRDLDSQMRTFLAGSVSTSPETCDAVARLSLVRRGFCLCSNDANVSSRNKASDIEGAPAVVASRRTRGSSCGFWRSVW